jgi:hypothetical protein
MLAEPLGWGLDEPKTMCLIVLNCQCLHFWHEDEPLSSVLVTFRIRSPNCRLLKGLLEKLSTVEIG